jgi:L-aspartate oxidase
MQNMLGVARLMIAAAADRRESRGVHFRRDFPQPDPALNHHISLRATASASDQSRGLEPLLEAARRS